MDKFLASELVDLAWSTMTRYLDNKKLSEHLKLEVLNKWINVRANSFVKSWLLIQKRKISHNKRPVVQK